MTTVAQTLVDLAAGSTQDDLSRMCHEAGVRYQTTPLQVAEVLSRWPNASGSGRLRRVLAGEVLVTLSPLERQFVSLLRANALPLPVMNRAASGRRVDCRWPDLRLTIELDSYRFHNTRHAWENDRRREREARARGDDFRRYTWADVVEAPGPIVTELRAVLAAHRPG